MFQSIIIPIVFVTKEIKEQHIIECDLYEGLYGMRWLGIVVND